MSLRSGGRQLSFELLAGGLTADDVDDISPRSLPDTTPDGQRRCRRRSKRKRGFLSPQIEEAAYEGEEPRGKGGGDAAPAFIVSDLRLTVDRTGMSIMIRTAAIAQLNCRWAMTTALRVASFVAHATVLRVAALPATPWHSLSMSAGTHSANPMTMNHTPWSSTDADRTTATPKILGTRQDVAGDEGRRHHELQQAVVTARCEVGVGGQCHQRLDGEVEVHGGVLEDVRLEAEREDGEVGDGKHGEGEQQWKR